MLRSVLALAAVVAMSSGTAGADPSPTSFTFTAEAGAHPVRGRSGHWTPPTLELRVGFRENTLRVHAENDGLRDYILLEVSRHDGQPLAAGEYHDQKVLVVNGSFGCVDDTADFTIERLERNADGWADVFVGTIEHTCGSRTDNMFRSHVRFVR